MTGPLPIIPLKGPIHATVRLPGSKSITNRALVLATLADGETRLEGALFSRDTRLMWEALKCLGFNCQVDTAAHAITVTGGGGRIPNSQAQINVGNAGTVARFLTAFVALRKDGVYQFDGDPAIRQRPMSGLLDALVQLGAAEFQYHGQAKCFPFTLKAKGYSGGRVTVDAVASSQILSALLLAAPAGTGTVEFTAPDVRPAYIHLTLKLQEAFGASLADCRAGDDINGYTLDPFQYVVPKGGCYLIEPDLSAASYFLALTLIQGGTLKLPDLNATSLQGDARFVEVLEKHGLQVDPTGETDKQIWVAHANPARFPIHQIENNGRHREINFNGFSDTFLTYAAMTPLLGGTVCITGIGHTRGQETDRIAGMATELSKLGQSVEEKPEALIITGKLEALRNRALHLRQQGRQIEIDTYEDHRFAMSFAILGSFDLLGDGQPWLSIKNPACCDKTFPEFFKTLERLHHD